jgi:hypothetical protein
MNEGDRWSKISPKERIAMLDPLYGDIQRLKADRIGIVREGAPLRAQILVLQEQYDTEFLTRIRVTDIQISQLETQRREIHYSLADYREVQRKAAERERKRKIFKLAMPALAGTADNLMRSEISMGVALGNVVKVALADNEITRRGYSLLEDGTPDGWSYKNNGSRILVGNRTAGAGVRLMLFRTGDIAVAYYPEDARENGACIIEADDILTGTPSAPYEVDERVTDILSTGDISLRVDGKRVTIPNPNNH